MSRRVLAVVGGAAAGAGLAYLLAGPVKRRVTALIAEKVKGDLAVDVRHLRRYAFASSQDISPIVGITHASYALNALDSLEEKIGHAGIRAAGYDPAKLRKFITELQDKHAEKLRACDAHLQQVLEIERAERVDASDPGHVVAGSWEDDSFSAPMGG
jgi:hypothetical protein